MIKDFYKLFFWYRLFLVLEVDDPHFVELISYTYLGGGNSNIFSFLTPIPGEDLVQPPTS